MSDNELSPFSRCAKWLIGIIIVISLVTYVASTVNSFLHTYRINSELSAVKDSPYFTDMEKCIADTVNPVSDRELIKELWKNQSHLYNTQSDFLADVRQETNNSLEKITSELNFWIAVLAIIGVFVPIAITYKGERDYKERLNIALEQSEKVSESFEESKNKYTDLMRQLNLELDVCSMNSARNNCLLENGQQTEEAYRKLSERTIRNFIKIFDDKIKTGDNLKEEDSKWQLTKMCMLCYDMLRNITLDHTGPTRPRYLYKAEDSIKQLIHELMKDIPDSEKVAEIFKHAKIEINNALGRLKSSY